MVRQDPAAVEGWFSEHEKDNKSSILCLSVDEKTAFDECRQSTCTVLTYSCSRLHSCCTVPTTERSVLTLATNDMDMVMKQSVKYVNVDLSLLQAVNPSGEGQCSFS